MKTAFVKAAIISLVVATPCAVLVFLGDMATPSKSPDPMRRIESIEILKNNRNLKSLGRIVEMLDDEQVAYDGKGAGTRVSDAALEALEDLFGGGFLEKTGDPVKARRLWKEYWNLNRNRIIYSPREDCFKVPGDPAAINGAN